MGEITDTMNRGDYGYGMKKLRQQILLCAGCCVLVFGALILGICLTGTRKNIFTVGAICSVLPAATFAVNIVARSKGLPLKKAEYRRIAEVTGDNVTACDMIVTANQKLVPIQAAVFSEHGIVGYTALKKIDVKQSERDVNGLLKSVGIYGKIQLFTDYDAFLKRVKGIAAPESEEVRKELEKKRYDFLVYSM